ncbi:hypothetical protein TNCV_2455091 [Trichonephila clavipes]|nr:hypothetical protein TNCV_2455091 [Trichonephila clavipes]
MYKRKNKPPKEEKNTKILVEGERAYSPVDERRRGKQMLRQGEKLNFRCRKVRQTRPLWVKVEPELNERRKVSFFLEKLCPFLLNRFPKVGQRSFPKVSFNKSKAIKEGILHIVSLIIRLRNSTDVTDLI